MIILDVDGETIVISIASPEGSYDEFRPKTEAVLNTIRWSHNSSTTSKNTSSSNSATEETSTVGENHPSGEPARPAPGYNLIQDPAGSITVETPSSWGVQTGSDSESAGANWSDFVGEDITSSVTTARSLEAWYSGTSEGSGAYIVASKTLAQKYTDDALIHSTLFSNLPTNHNCTTIGDPKDFVRPPYSGQMQAYSGCDGNNSTYVVVAAAPEGRECVVVLEARTSSEADRGAVQHILNTFDVDCSRVS
jgi:hypothetical protein